MSEQNQATSTARPGCIRRWLMLLILIVILIGVNLLYTPAQTWRGVQSGEPGTVLYAAGFDGFQEEWVQDPGRDSQAIVDEKMRLSLGTVTTIFSQAEPHFADFDLRVTASTIDGPEDNAYGVIFRLNQDERQCNLPLVLLCDLSQTGISRLFRALLEQDTQPAGYYMFLISADGYYSLWRGDDENPVSNWIASDLIRTGMDAENDLRVVARGNRFQFYINGQPVDLCLPTNPDAISTYVAGTCVEGEMVSVWEDDTFQTGQIGVVAQATLSGGPGVVVDFDNVAVLEPDDGSSREANRA